ncbi:MAG: FtsX-like permease family protein, partial [Acidobacteria bacterium]
ILPSEFRFPRWDTVIWKALDFAGVPTTQPASFPMAYVRFAAGQPRADGLRMATEAARAADARNGKLVPIIRPLAAIDPYYERAVPLLAGGVMLVFLGLCANVSSLLLARLTERRREFGMRSALGASRGRVIRQAFLESGTLGTLGIAGGIALACVIVSVARVLLPEALLVRTLNPLNIDLRSLAIASAFGVGATLAAGLLPAWIGTRVDPIQSLRVSERAGTETRNARAFTRGLLVAEIALACILLVGATLLVRSFLNLAATDRGLDAHGVVTTSISLDRPVFSNPALRRSVAQSIEDQIRGLPGVGQLAWSYGLPPSRGVHSFGDWTPDMPGAPVVNMEVDIYSASPEFFALYGIPLLRGRSFQPSDSERAIVAGERFAKALFPNVDPIGRTVVFDTQQFEIIGIVREIHYPSLDPHVDRPEFYTAFSGIERFGTAMNIRCRDICPDAAVVRQRILRAHPDIRVIDARLLEDVYFEQLAQPRAAAALGFAFAAIATVAAAAGLFSVLSYTVSRRLREFGIRRALGASSADIRWLVLRDGLLVTSAGVAFGVVASWFVAPMMASLQYGVTITDAANWAAVFGLIAATTLFASWRPARAAGRADPVLLLKEE